MSGGLGYLTAVYRDGRVYIGSKSYAAGIFAAHLLNRYYRNDTAARIAVFRQSNWNVQEQLAAGYLSSVDFVNAGEEIQNILLTLPKLKPFDTLDPVSEKQRISEMFTEENAELLSDYFIRRGKAAQAMAKRRLEQAEKDDAYAKTNYYADLERAKLYADTGKRMK